MTTRPFKPSSHLQVTLIFEPRRWSLISADKYIWADNVMPSFHVMNPPDFRDQSARYELRFELMGSKTNFRAKFNAMVFQLEHTDYSIGRVSIRCSQRRQSMFHQIYVYQKKGWVLWTLPWISKSLVYSKNMLLRRCQPTSGYGSISSISTISPMWTTRWEKQRIMKIMCSNSLSDWILQAISPQWLLQPTRLQSVQTWVSIHYKTVQALLFLNE